MADNLAASRVSLSFDMDSAVAEPHRKMLAAFDQLSGSQRSWVVQTTQHIDRVKARSTAGTVMSRVAAKLGRRAHALIDTNDLPLALGVQNGKATAYFYPGFVLVVSAVGSNFAVIDLKDTAISYDESHFTETEAVPSDAVPIGKTWAKSNKNGSRDKRFKHNRELPVMLYGRLNLSSPGGMNEAFMFSRSDACQEFVVAVTELKRILVSGSKQEQVKAGRKAITARR